MNYYLFHDLLKQKIYTAYEWVMSTHPEFFNILNYFMKSTLTDFTLGGTKCAKLLRVYIY